MHAPVAIHNLGDAEIYRYGDKRDSFVFTKIACLHEEPSRLIEDVSHRGIKGRYVSYSFDPPLERGLLKIIGG